MRRFNGWVIPVLALWALCVAVWVALLFTEDTLGCDELTPGGSDYGTATWQWTPPGIKCTYVLSGGDHIDRPSTARFGIIGLLVLWPATVLLVGRRQDDQDDDAPHSN